MAGYNVKVFEFANGEIQARFYDHPVSIDYDNDYEPDDKPLSIVLDCREPFTNQIVKEVENLLPDLTEEERAIKQERSIAVSLNRTKNAIYQYARANKWDYFLTLTCSEDYVDRYDFTKVSKKVRKWFNHIQRKCPDMKYLVVWEPHIGPDAKYGPNGEPAYHFHALVANVEGLTFTPAVNNMEFYHGKKNKYFGTPLLTSYPDGEPIYNLADFKIGFTEATRVKDSCRAAMYIAKYITKECVVRVKNRKRYYNSTNLELPKVWTTTMDGDILHKINELAEKLDKKNTHLSGRRVLCENFQQEIFYCEYK